MTCAEPLDAALLADYWMHLVSIETEAEIEEHLLACDECGTRLREAIAIADGVRQVVQDGTVRLARRSEF